MGVLVAQERTHAGVDDRRNQRDEQDQVDEAGRRKKRQFVEKTRETFEIKRVMTTDQVACSVHSC